MTVVRRPVPTIAGMRDRHAHAAPAARPAHDQPGSSRAGSTRRAAAARVAADGVRARGGARRRAREPDRLAGDDALPEQRGEHRDERQQGDELDGGLALFGSAADGGHARTLARACHGSTRVCDN